MKEIKAYVRRDCVNKAVNALQQAGAPGVTIVEVHPVGDGYDPNYFELHFEDALKRYKLWHVVKLEMVCRDDDVERFLIALCDVCRTGSHGDGKVFVSEITEAVRIRDSARGESALG